tara:strand:+ start:1631 stop:1876 length:246 start_codon:yes stop_codon:yes gene_type:complete
MLRPVTELPETSVADRLRAIADQLEAGEFGEVDEATLVFPGATEMFHLGGSNLQAGVNALFNCSCAITKITLECVGGGDVE